MLQHEDLHVKMDEKKIDMNAEMDEMKMEMNKKEMKKEMSDMKGLMISLILLIRNIDVPYTLETYDNHSSPTPSHKYMYHLLHWIW